MLVPETSITTVVHEASMDPNLGRGDIVVHPLCLLLSSPRARSSEEVRHHTRGAGIQVALRRIDSGVEALRTGQAPDEAKQDIFRKSTAP